MFGKALAVNSDLKPGHIITFEDLEGKKPADGGIDVNNYVKIIGKKLETKKKRGDFLTYQDLSINYKELK